jgi:hypothetical protein
VSTLKFSQKSILLTLCILILFVILNPAFGQYSFKPRNILTNKAKEIDLSKSLITDNSWNKLPAYKDRKFWQSLPANIREAYVQKAESLLTYDWPTMKATDFLEIIRSGERREKVQNANLNALEALVMGELVEGKGRFMDQIINGVWYFCEQTWWGWSAHFYLQQAPNGLPDIKEPTIDLGVGEIANNLAWALYLFKEEFDKIHPLISIRLKDELTRRVLIPYYTRDDFWWMGPRKESYSVNKPSNPWVNYKNDLNPNLLVSAKIAGSGVNNWNPWVNYNMLNCILLVESDPAKKLAGVEKVVRCIDNFPNSYPDDGGCNEGPMYWGVAGAVFAQSLFIVKNATSGKLDVFDNQLIKNIGTYFCKANIHAPYFIDFADADATGTGSPFEVYQYGKAIHDTQMQQFGAYLIKLSNWGTHSFSGNISKQIEQLSMLEEIRNAEAKEALVADFWLPDTEIAGARDAEGSFKGFFFGAKGGNNAESHNHNDVGSAVMYFDGKPCLIDLGREAYTAKTFSPNRYEIWTMQSLYHNLPVINGTAQQEGGEFKAKNSAFHADKMKATFLTEISGAYPQSANAKSWVRTYTLNRGKNFIISDKFKLKSLSNEATSSNLMTYCKVKEVSPGKLLFEGDGFNLNMTYNPKLITPKIEFYEVKDSKLHSYWPNGVSRVVMTFIKPALKGTIQMMFTEAKD